MSDRVEPVGELAALRRLGKYSIVGVLGKGSMGVLYKAVDRLNKPVALKTLQPHLSAMRGTEFANRLRVEAQAGRLLEHPGIVSVHEFGEHGAHAFIAMEFIEGRSLKDYFDSSTSFSVAHGVNIVSQLLAALHHAHERGVWHRDVKPANIVLLSSGEVKLADFGIARIASRDASQEDEIMGTPGFVAPEMYLGDFYDRRVDVFAAGAVLYRLLVGAPAFEGTPDKIMFKVCCETPLAPSVAAARPSLQHIDAVVMRALARRPEDRFATAEEFRGGLLEAQAAMVRART